MKTDTRKNVRFFLAETPFEIRGPHEVLTGIEQFFQSFRQNGQPENQAPRIFEVFSDRGGWVLTEGGIEKCRGPTMQHFFLRCMSTFTDVFGDEIPTETVLVHSAGFFKDGTAVCLFGPRNAGKSTAVHRLYNPGINIISDELIAYELDSRTLYPFPRPLNLGFNKEVSPPFEAFPLQNMHGYTFVYALPPSGAMLTEPIKAGRMNWVQLRRGEGPTCLEELKTSVGISQLLEHCYRPDTPPKAFRGLARMLRGPSSMYRLQYESIEQAEDELLSLLESG